MDLAPHGLDLVDHLLGEPVTEIAALTQNRVQPYAVDDGAMLVGRTGSGVLVQLHVAYNCPEALPRRRLEVLGTRGQLTASRTMGQSPGGTLDLTDGRLGLTRRLVVPDAEASPFARQMAAFARWIVTGEGRDFDLARDLHTMRLLDRAYRSATPCP
jgi:predicted dehydrogenase